MRVFTKEEQIMKLFGIINAKMRRNAPQPTDNNSNVQAESNCGQQKRFGAGRILGLINDNGKMNQVQIAQLLEIRPQSLSEALCKLESEGFITRECCPSDRRQTLVSITDSGKERVAVYRERHRAEADDFLSALNDEEKETLFTLLSKIEESRKDN